MFVDVALAGAVVAFIAALLVQKQPVSFLHVETDTKILAIAGASVLWGIYTGSQPVVESIFADSVATGTAWSHILLCSLEALVYSLTHEVHGSRSAVRIKQAAPRHAVPTMTWRGLKI